MNQMLTKRFLNLSEFVRHSGLSESTVRRRARDGSLQVVQLGGKGKKLLFPIDALEHTNNQTLSTIDHDVDKCDTIPSTEAQADRPSGPRPRWAQKLTRRPR